MKNKSIEILLSNISSIWFVSFTYTLNEKKVSRKNVFSLTKRVFLGDKEKDSFGRSSFLSSDSMNRDISKMNYLSDAVHKHRSYCELVSIEDSTEDEAFSKMVNKSSGEVGQISFQTFEECIRDDIKNVDKYRDVCIDLASALDIDTDDINDGFYEQAFDDCISPLLAITTIMS